MELGSPLLSLGSNNGRSFDQVLGLLKGIGCLRGFMIRIYVKK